VKSIWADQGNFGPSPHKLIRIFQGKQVSMPAPDKNHLFL
jgi:hypothetical protein